jgi:hypothetical protein
MGVGSTSRGGAICDVSDVLEGLPADRGQLSAARETGSSFVRREASPRDDRRLSAHKPVARRTRPERSTGWGGLAGHLQGDTVAGQTAPPVMPSRGAPTPPDRHITGQVWWSPTHP